MKRLTALTSRGNACHGFRFEQAVGRYSLFHQPEVLRLKAALEDPDPETGWELTDAVRTICEGVLDYGGYHEDDGWSVCTDIYDIDWEVVPA